MALRTIVLEPGQCVVLPQSAVISSIVMNGDASVTSTCGELPSPENYKCGYFFIVLDADDNSGHSMDENTSYVSVKVGSNTYVINELVTSGGSTPTPTAYGTLNLHITDLALFKFTAITETEVTSRTHIHVYFQAPESLWDTIQLKVDNNGVGSYQIYEPLEAVCGEYENPA